MSDIDEANRRLMDQCAEAKPLPWWVWKTTRWPAGLTTVSPFWRPIHIKNMLTQLYGWYLVKRGY